MNLSARTVLALCMLAPLIGCKRKELWNTDFEMEIECGGSCLPGESVGVPGASVVADAPQPSQDARAPEIYAIEVEESEGGFTLNVSVNSIIQIENVYIQMDDLVIQFPAGSDDAGNPYFTKQACDVLAEQQGHECTQSCLDACGCVRCDSEQTSIAMIQACAVPCSLLANDGWEDVEELYINEQDYAYKLYNGTTINNERVAGILDDVSFCEASRCEPVETTDKVIGVPFIGPDYTSSLQRIRAMGSAIYVESRDPVSNATLVSQPFEGGRICPGAAGESGALPTNPCN